MILGLTAVASDEMCATGDGYVPCDALPGEDGFPISPSDAETFIGLGVGAFILVTVLMFAAVIGLGVAAALWQRRKAAEIARSAGMDVEAAKAVAMTEGGLQSTYLASQLRGAGIGTTAAPSAEQRLRELQSLLDQGLITQAEFDERRAAIINGI